MKYLPISIIIPVYNTREEYLDECFRSIRNQTTQDFEVIIVDDGSNKETADFCDNFAEKYHGWSVIHKKNEGLNAARRTGFNNSHGKYVTFVDSDDAIDCEFISRLYESCKKNKTDIAVCDSLEFISNKKIERQTDKRSGNAPVVERNGSKLLEYIISGNYPNMGGYSAVVWGKLYSRTLLSKVDWDFCNYRINEDEFFSPQTHMLADSGVSFVYEQLYFYRRGLESSLSVPMRPNSHNGRHVSYLRFAYELLFKTRLLLKSAGIDLDEMVVDRYVDMIQRRSASLAKAGRLEVDDRRELLWQYKKVWSLVSKSKTVNTTRKEQYMINTLCSNEKFSIIIPVYNTKEVYLKDCLDSCVNQTCNNLDIIVVDDGSNHKIAEYCDNYAKNDKRIKVIHKTNDGLNNARHTGFEASTGRWITFVDSDDIIDPTFIMKLYYSCEHNHTDMAVAEYLEFTNVDNIDKTPSGHISKTAEHSRKKLLKYTVNGGYPKMRVYSGIVCCKLYNNKLLNKIDWNFSNYRINEDEFFSIQTSLYSNGISFVQEQLYFYRRGSEDSLSVSIKPNNHNGRPVSHLRFAHELYSESKKLFKENHIRMDELLVNKYAYMIQRRVKELYRTNQFNNESREELMWQHKEMEMAVKKSKTIGIDWKNFYSLLTTKPDIMVTVIVPVYNTDKEYLEECFNAIEKQTYPNIEVLIVDDGSNKKTARYCDNYANNINGWKVIHKANGGSSSARNDGLHNARGKYVLFTDSDDICHTRMVERLVVESEMCGADMAICRYIAFDAKTGDVIYQEKETSSVKIAKQIISRQTIPDDIFNVTTPFVNTKLFRRKFLIDNNIEFDTGLIRGEDLLFTYETLLMATRACVIEEHLFRYRVNVSSSVMSNKRATNMTTFLALQRLKKYIEDKELYNLVKRSYVRRVFDTALFDYQDQDELFIKQYREIREFLLTLEKDINESVEFFNITNPGYLVYNDVMNIIKNDKPTSFYIDKASAQSKQIAEQQKYINSLEYENSQLNKPGIKFAVRKLLGAVKRRLVKTIGR